MTASDTAGRSRTLDILRAVAVLAVLGRHMQVCPPEVNAFLHDVTRVWQRGGYTGVDLFFVLSGFLIAGLLFREHQRYGSISYGKFFIRRGLKIYPPFFAMIAATVAVRALQQRPVAMRDVISELVFVQNYFGSLWNHTWSLAIEEHFYILLPIALILALRFRNRGQETFAWIPFAFVLVAAACLALRMHAAATRQPFHDQTHLFPTHLRIDSLLCGVVIAYFFHYRSVVGSRSSVVGVPSRENALTTDNRLPATDYRLPTVFLGIACFVPAYVFPVDTTPFMYTFGPALLWLGGALLLFPLVSREPRDSRIANAVAFVGSRSYSIYLWHMPFAAWAVGAPMRALFGGFNWYFYAAWYLAGSIVLGIVMAAVVEYPVLRLRDRLFPSRSRPLEVT